MRLFDWLPFANEKKEAEKRLKIVRQQELRVTASIARRQQVLRENNFGTNIKKAMGG